MNQVIKIFFVPLALGSGYDIYPASPDAIDFLQARRLKRFNVKALRDLVALREEHPEDYLIIREGRRGATFYSRVIVSDYELNALADRNEQERGA